MTEAILNSHRFELKHILAFLLHPRQESIHLSKAEKPVWQFPMLILSVLQLLRIIVTGYLQAHAAAMGQSTLPADWQWWTPDMQNNYLQAIQATHGPVFVYIIPAVIGLARLWLGWLLVAAGLHLASTFLGGRGSMRSILNLLAWTFLPFALRDLIRIIFMLLSKEFISSPGLSGFANALFLSKVLASVDLFFIWFSILLVIGLRVTDNLSAGKSLVSVTIVLLLVLLLQGGLGTLGATLGGLIDHQTLLLRIDKIHADAIHPHNESVQTFPDGRHDRASPRWNKP